MSDHNRKPILNNLLGQLQNSLYKNSLILIIDSAVTAGLGFIFWMIIARFYNAVDVGFGSAAISAISLLASLSLIGASFTLIRFLPHAEKPVEMINSYLSLSGVIALILAVVFLVGINLWSPALSFIKEHWIFGAAFTAFTLFLSMNTIVRNVFIAHRRAELTLTIDTTQSLLKIPLAILMVLFFHSFGIASAWGITITIGVLLALFIFLPKCQKSYRPLPGFNIEILGKLWRYSTGNYVASLLSTAPTWILPIMVVNMIGSEQNAYFYITWTIYSLLGAIPVAASNSLFAEGSYLSKDLSLNIRKTLKFTYLLLIPFIIIVLFLANFILDLFGPEYSVHGSELLKIMAVSSLFVSLNTVYHTLLRIKSRILELCILDAIQAVIALAGSYLILPVMGTKGIGFIWLGVQILISLYVFFRIRNSIKSVKPELK